MVVRSVVLAGLLLVSEGGTVWSASVEAVALIVFIVLVSQLNGRRKSE